MDIKKLLKGPESKTLEFKRDLSSLKPILKTLIAFANTAGGILVIGIEDDGKITGLKDIQKQQDKLANSIAENILPKLLFPEFEFYTYKGKDLLIVQVHHMPQPFYLKQEGDINGVYLRLGATSRQAPPEFIAEIQRRQSNQYFDEEPCLTATMSDLNHELISAIFKDKSKITQSKLLSLNIACKYNGKVYPTNGGVILFAKDNVRLSHFPNTEISCARFNGKTKADFIDRLDLTSSSLVSIDEIPKFIRRNTTMAAEFGEIKRKDIPQYPVIAIREVLINAFIHASYELRGSRFFIAIYDDRLEIQNPGSFPPGMTIEDFKAGISKLRNPTVSRVFREKEKLEAWGSGYGRICEICNEEGYPLPIWSEIGPVIRVTFYPHEATAKKALSRHQAGTKQAPSRRQVGTKQALGDIESKILKFCVQPRRIADIMQSLGYSDRSKFRNRYVNRLLEAELLEMSDPNSPNSPKQEYRVTEEGRKLIK